MLIAHFHIIRFNSFFIPVDIRVSFVNLIKFLGKMQSIRIIRLLLSLCAHMENFVLLRMTNLKYLFN